MNDQPFDPTKPETSATVAAATAQVSAQEAFSLWIDAELEKLVARWVHLAAPNANRPPKVRSRR